MNELSQRSFTAFKGFSRIAAGDIVAVARCVKEIFDKNQNAPILVFDDLTSDQIGIDLRGTVEDVLKRLAKKTDADSASEPDRSDTREPRGPGRPKLGVVAREVTLLPRHWDWLNTQPGGASVALRKLVEKARHENAGKDMMRQAQDASYKFMSALAGDLPDFEEATRALFAGDRARFDALVGVWPGDVGDHAKKLAAKAFQVP